MQWKLSRDHGARMPLQQLSVQEVLNCNDAYANCWTGGWMTYAWDKSANDGSQLEYDYPYSGYQWRESNRQWHCPGLNEKEVASKASRYGYLPIGGEGDAVTMMSNHLYHWGPLALAVHASIEFETYQDGIVTLEDLRNGDSLYLQRDYRYFPYDHAVVLVGQGVADDGTQYWILQNSWGSDWGEKGFMRVAKEGGIGLFGMNSWAMWMDVEQGYPKWEYQRGEGGEGGEGGEL